MTLVWNDAKSFKQHLEDMRMFRQSHRGELEGKRACLKHLPIPGDVYPQSSTGGARFLITARDKSVIVPMWDLVLPKNSQN